MSSILLLLTSNPIDYKKMQSNLNTFGRLQNQTLRILHPVLNPVHNNEFNKYCFLFLHISKDFKCKWMHSVDKKIYIWSKYSKK